MTVLLLSLAFGAGLLAGMAVLGYFWFRLSSDQDDGEQ